MALQFNILASDGAARVGLLKTDHGDVRTPTVTVNFTPALQRSGLKPSQLKALGVDLVLVNTLHCLRDNVKDVHQYLDWNGPVMADSGGFQMVSLSEHLEVHPNGIRFRMDDTAYELTPSKVVDAQKRMGVDVMMPLDRVVHVLDKNPVNFLRSAIASNRWFRQSVSTPNTYFIVQGGLNRLARLISLRAANRQLVNGVTGIAIGGLAGGEARPAMYRMVRFCTERLPLNAPRHLFGVGTPVDLLECIEQGIDTFDCVAATREARHGRVWIGTGYLRLRNGNVANDWQPIESGCDCPTCASGATRAELRTALRADDETLRERARIQLMLHNIRFTQRLMEGARRAIREGRFMSFKQEFLSTFKPS